MNTKTSTKYSITAGILASVYMLLPSHTQALSCITPMEYIPELVSIDSESVIFTGEITDTTAVDGNVTTLTVAVDSALQGTSTEVMQVQYEYDETWGYLCAGAPSEVGTIEAFIVRPSDDDVPYVTYTFGLDTDLYEVLGEAIAEKNPVATLVKDAVEESGETIAAKRSLLVQIIELLRQLIARIR